jgi:hypothetical protein
LEWSGEPLCFSVIQTYFDTSNNWTSFQSLFFKFLTKKVYPTLIDSLRSTTDKRITAERLLLKMPVPDNNVDLTIAIRYKQILLGESDSARASAMRIISENNRLETLSKSQIFLLVHACLTYPNSSLKKWALTLLKKVDAFNSWYFQSLMQTALQDHDPEIREAAALLVSPDGK